MRHEYKVSSSEIYDITPIIRAPECWACLSEICARFRQNQKYNDGPTTWVDAYELLWEVLKEHNIDPFSDV